MCRIALLITVQVPIKRKWTRAWCYSHKRILHLNGISNYFNKQQHDYILQILSKEDRHRRIHVSWHGTSFMVHSKSGRSNFSDWGQSSCFLGEVERPGPFRVLEVFYCLIYSLIWDVVMWVVHFIKVIDIYIYYLCTVLDVSYILMKKIYSKKYKSWITNCPQEGCLIIM